MIRPMRREDAVAAARLYRERLTQSFYARLGVPFVAELLWQIAKSPYGIGLIYDEQGVDGFIFAATDAPKLFASLKWKPSLGIHALGAGLRSWNTLKQIVSTPFYFSEAGLPEIHAELLYIAVPENEAGAGRSKELLSAMLKRLHKRGVNKVKVTTESDNQRPQGLLKGFGFKHAGSFRFYEKPMEMYYHDDLSALEKDA